jgi:DNA repair exonuclease SbcCD nuclease subunit
MKIICIGDIHASGFNDDPLVNNLPARLNYIQQSLNYIVDYGRKNNIHDYIILGDVYHDKTIIYNISQSVLHDFFNSNMDLNFTIISGNHDLSATGENQKSAIQLLNEIDNVTCILDPQIKEICGKNYFFVPYTHDFISVLKQKIKLLENVDVLFSHIGLNEAVLQSGLSKVDKLTINDLSCFKLAILGHYHKPQVINGNKTTVYYAGSLIPKDWNDKNETKRFLVFDTDTLQVDSVDIDCGVPGFYEFKIETDDTKEKINEILNQANNLKKFGHKVRVINKNKQKIKNDISDIIILEHKEVDITNRGITVEQTKIEQCKKYLEIKEIPEDERDLYIQILNNNKLLEVIDER